MNALVSKVDQKKINTREAHNLIRSSKKERRKKEGPG